MINMKQSKIRESNLELLRIVCMFLIIGHHYAIYGGWGINRYAFISNCIIDFLSIGGKVGVICFMMITGYFMIYSTYKPKKLFKLIVQTLEYSISISLLIFFISDFSIPKSELFHSFFPVIFREYWFITGYIIVYILTPYLNKMVLHMEKRHLEYLLMTLFILFIGINTIFLSSLGNNHENFTYLLYFYLIGAYIRVYYAKDISKNSAKKYLYRFLLSYGLIFFTMLIFECLTKLNPTFQNYINTYIAINRIPAFLAGIYLFCCFKNWNIGYYSWINKIGGMVLGVYLLHDHPLIRSYLWQNLFRNSQFYYSNILGLHALITIIIVFIIGIVVEQIRLWIMALKPVKFLYQKIENHFLKLSQIDLGKIWERCIQTLIVK